MTAIPPSRFNTVYNIANELNQSFDALHSAILRTTNDAYRDVIGKAVSMQSTGAITTRQAIKQALNDFADRGITGFTDRAGRHWHMDSYAEMAVRTGMMRASTQGYMDDALAHGENLVIISDHQDTCPLCIDWERTVLALDDAGLNHPDCDGSLAEAEAAGLFHPNCLHSMTVYIPGLSIKASGKSKQGYTREMDMEGYRNRQQQRHMERQVRNWKRRQAVATTPEDERYAKAHVDLWQRRLRERIDNTGLLRLYYREGGRVNLSEAAKKLKPFKVAPNGTIIKPAGKSKSNVRINSPIERRHSGKGQAAGISYFDQPLTNRQQRILDSLPEFDSRIIMDKSEVSMADLAALTAKLGDEFAMFSLGSKRLIVRGNSYETRITPEEARRLNKEGWRWSGHTHPGVGRQILMPSEGDLQILDEFDNGHSVIYNSAGQHSRFTKRRREE